MNAFYEHHQHNIAFHYRCFDASCSMLPSSLFSNPNG